MRNEKTEIRGFGVLCWKLSIAVFTKSYQWNPFRLLIYEFSPYPLLLYSNFHNIFHSKPRPVKWLLPLRFSEHNFVCMYMWGSAIAQWLRCWATNRKVVGSIPAGFSEIKSFRSHYGPGVDSASNRNEYLEYFLRVKTAGA